ncbi:MAG: glycosyltransferase family 4 protein [Salinivirgaceae bacterium]
MIYLIALLTSIGLTYLVRQLALKKNIIDNPNERSSHTVPTPRGGGLAIVLVWFGGLLLLFLQHKIEASLFFALLSGLVLAVVSFLDDIFDLKPIIRILAQAFSALGALYFLGGFQLLPDLNHTFVVWILNFLFFIGIIWFINLFNFLDGIDGYASQEAIMVAAGLLLLTRNQLLGLLMAAVAGFLCWNRPKAKIFMGDVGSTQLGFVLVVLGLYFHNTGEISILSWLVLTSLFWFDATFTLYRRWRNKEQLSKAHKKHAYQRLTQGGWSHLKVDLWAMGLNFLFIAAVYLTQQHLAYQWVLLIGVVILLVAINYRVDSIFGFRKD